MKVSAECLEEDLGCVGTPYEIFYQGGMGDCELRWWWSWVEGVLPLHYSPIQAWSAGVTPT